MRKSASIRPSALCGFHFGSLFEYMIDLREAPVEKICPGGVLFLESNSEMRNISNDQNRAPLRTFQAQLPLRVSLSASAR